MKTLVVGCGLKPKPGCVNLDKEKLPGVDVVFDLDTIGRTIYTPQPGKFVSVDWDLRPTRLPFRDEEFDRVEAEDVLEHLNDPVTVVQELGRVLKVGGTLWVRGPDETMVWHDLTHKRAFTERTFDGFCPGTYDGKYYGHYHGPIKFAMRDKRLVNHGWEYTMIRIDNEEAA